MTSRKRVWQALKKENVDFCPKGEILITSDFIEQSPYPDTEAFLSCLNTDLVTFPVSYFSSNKQHKYWRNKNYFIFGLVQGPFTLLLEKLGWRDLSRLIIKKPREAKQVMFAGIKDSLPPVHTALNSCCEGIIIADDLAGNKGLLISPSFLKEIYFPLLASWLEKIDCKNVPVLFHSDGNIMSIIPLLVQSGFWGIHCLQTSAGITIDSFSQELLQSWCFWGNVEFENFIPMKADEIEDKVFEILQTWAGVPGYIFGSSGGVYQKLPPEVVKTAYGAADKWKLIK